MIVFQSVVLICNLGCVGQDPSSLVNVTVTYNANGGDVLQFAQTVSAGGTIALPAPTRSGYVFSGWHTAIDGGIMVGKSGDNYVVEADVTLYAHWLAGVTIYYSANGGIVSQATEVVTTGSMVILPAATRIGYVFIGWHDKHGEMVGTAGDEYIVKGDIVFQGALAETLIAEWRRIVTITFNANGGSNSPPPIAQPAESNFQLPVITRSGYIFSGWYTTVATNDGEKVGDAGDVYTIPITALANTVLYAKWAPGDVTITYNANGGNVVPLAETATAGSIILLPLPTLDGHVFSGWFSAISSGVKAGGAGDSFKLDANVELYAQWYISI